jgi:hypothetical protein
VSTVVGIRRAAVSDSYAGKRSEIPTQMPWPGNPIWQQERGRGLAVNFQHVVPFSDDKEQRRRRSGAKVEISHNDFQGADLARRLLHHSA